METQAVFLPMRLSLRPSGALATKSLILLLLNVQVDWLLEVRRQAASPPQLRSWISIRQRAAARSRAEVGAVILKRRPGNDVEPGCQNVENGLLQLVPVVPGRDFNGSVRPRR